MTMIRLPKTFPLDNSFALFALAPDLGTSSFSAIAVLLPDPACVSYDQQHRSLAVVAGEHHSRVCWLPTSGTHSERCFFKTDAGG